MDQTRFWGLPLLTSPGRVMNPRAASERLVAASLELIGETAARVVDVGTGSGALAIAIASAAPRALLWATDTSPEAVAIARANVWNHGLAHRITVCHGDLLGPVPGAVDLIVANLPYLPAVDAARFPDLAAEPSGAVFAEGDGLDSYRRLLGVCPERLTARGALVIQLHRQALSAKRDELPILRAELEAVQRSVARLSVPQLLAAAA
jgi:HemK-like putative methylase